LPTQRSRRVGEYKEYESPTDKLCIFILLLLESINLCNFAEQIYKYLFSTTSVSKKDFSWQTKIYLPKMRLDGRYEMAGRILLIPLSGSGKIFIEIGN